MNRWWWQWPLTDRASWDHAPYQCDFATSTWSPFLTHLWVALWIASLVSCFGQWNAAEVILLEFRSPGLSFSLCPLGRQPWNQQTVKELVWPPRGWAMWRGAEKPQSRHSREALDRWVRAAWTSQGSTNTSSEQPQWGSWGETHRGAAQSAHRNNKSLFVCFLTYGLFK